MGNSIKGYVARTHNLMVGFLANNEGVNLITLYSLIRLRAGGLFRPALLFVWLQINLNKVISNA